MEETASGPARFKAEKYVALVTYRRSGVEVFTPVWVAVVADRLVMMTGRRTGKARRIRNNPRVRLAPSNGLGRPRGEFADVTAREITDARLREKAEAALAAKYGWQFRLLGLIDRLRRGRTGPRVYLELTPVE